MPITVNCAVTLLYKVLKITGDIPRTLTLRENPPEITPVDRLGSGPRFVGPIGSGVRVSASFQIFALRMLLHSAEVTSRGFSLGVISGGVFPVAIS